MTSKTTIPLEIRKPAREDMGDILRMCNKHAAHERESFDAKKKQEKLASSIFSPESSLLCLVASLDQKPVGYATYTIQYSTWNAGNYLYMDCLFIEEEFRGRGFGRAMMKHISEEAKNLGCKEIQWQTPCFNLEAVQFYDGLRGSSRNAKWRYTWPA